MDIKTDITPAFNRRLAQWRVKWLIEHSTSHQLLWCIDSCVLLNQPLREAPKRFMLGRTTYNKCQRTFGTFASPDPQADASAYKRAKFLPTLIEIS